MKKVKLNLDDLKVESFVTTPTRAEVREGTVFAYEETWPPGVDCYTWDSPECESTEPWGTCGGATTPSACNPGTGSECIDDPTTPGQDTCDATCTGCPPPPPPPPGGGGDTEVDTLPCCF